MAGTPAQVAAALSSAEPYREELLARGVLVAEVPVFDATSEAGAGGAAPATAPPPPVAVDTDAPAAPNESDVRCLELAVLSMRSGRAMRKLIRSVQLAVTAI